MLKRYRFSIIGFIFLMIIFIFVVRCMGINLMFGDGRSKDITPMGMIIFLSYIIPLVLVEFTCIHNFIRMDEEMGIYYLIRDSSGLQLFKLVVGETLKIISIYIFIKFLILCCAILHGVYSNSIIDLLYSIPSTLSLLFIHTLFFFTLWKKLRKRWLFPLHLALMFIIYFIVFVNESISNAFISLWMPKNEYILFYLIVTGILMIYLQHLYKEGLLTEAEF